MRRISIIAGSAAFALLLWACSKDGREAPRSGHAATFVASVGDMPGGFTRATVDNSWAGGESVAVSIEGRVKKYVSDASGMLAAAAGETPFYWSGSELQVRAWHFGRYYLSAEPDNISLSGDQSGGGYLESDFLFASGVVARSNPVLAFTHKTAKVVVNVRSDGVIVEGVSLGDGNLSLSGVWNKSEERIEPSQGGSESVIPQSLSAAQGFDASYSALLVPQDMEGKSFIRVTVGGKDYRYTPKSGEAVLEGGKRYTYNVTVRNGITVETSVSGAWSAGGETEIGSYVGYAASDLKPGDYYYADGTWSDGGLREKHSDGRLEWATPKPLPTAGKKVIGIVFQTDLSRISAKEKELFASNGKTLHGVAMSVQAAGMGLEYCWYYDGSLSGSDAYTRDESIEDGNHMGYVLPNINYKGNDLRSFEIANADINGYFNSQVIKVRRAADLDAGLYPAFWWGINFWYACGGPAGNVFTSDWYLPSAGQWLDFLRNVGGIPLDPADMKGYGDGSFYWYVQGGNVMEALNKAMSGIPAGDKTTYDGVGDFYWTSSAAAADEARDIFFRSNGYVVCDKYSKDVGGRVRGAIAF